MTSGRLSRYLNLRVAALLLPLALAAPGGGLATTLQRFDLAQLTANATQIFVGRCHSAKTEIESEQVYTHYLFSVEQMIKGDPAQEVHVHLLGGKFQGVRHTIVGMPTFVPGERVVLFLTALDDRGHAWPVGLEQGKFRIVFAAASDEEPRVFQSLSSGAEFLTLTDHAAKPAAEAVETGGLYLSEFLSRVRDLTGAGGTDDKPNAR